MTQRLNPFTASPAAMQPWIELGKTIQTNGLEPLLRELVMTRASQINGCAFCIHHHITDARKYGETEGPAAPSSEARGGESALYSDREPEPRSAGPRLSRWCPKPMRRTMLTRCCCAGTSVRMSR